jgi:hypothetical protein
VVQAASEQRIGGCYGRKRHRSPGAASPSGRWRGGRTPKDAKHILRRKVARNFTNIPNEVLRDRLLHWGDKGLLCFLLSLPEDFELNYQYITRFAPNGEDSVRTSVKRLSERRYLQLQRERGAQGRYVRVVWTVSDEPTLGSSEPDPENPGEGDSAEDGSRLDVPAQAKPAQPSTVQNKEPSTTTTNDVVVVGLDDPPLRAYREAALKSLATCPPDLRQQVVDETLGAAEAKVIRKNAGAYLRALCAAARQGEFVLQAGVSIAGARQRHKEDLERRVADEAERQARDTPEARERGRRARDEALAKLGLLRPRPSPSVAADGAAK